MASVVVIGAGLAGLSAAVELGRLGHRVTLLESKSRLGGRAGSFVDPTTGQIIDACQHVSMGCCTELARFCETVGVSHLLAAQPELYFVTPDRRISRFAADPLPAPFHLSRSLWRAHYLTFGDKLRIAWGMLSLLRARPTDDPPLLPWLKQHRQNQRTIDRFWGVVLVSALNESVERVGLKYARKVFLDGFLRDRRGFEVYVPTVPLDRLYGAELLDWFIRHQVQLELNAGVKSIDMTGDRVAGLTLRDGRRIEADWYVSTVPAARLANLLPALAHLDQFEVSPIASVHLWFDRPAMDLPHAVLVDCVGQWAFNRGEVAPGEHYVQVVVSAAHELRRLGGEKTGQAIESELRRLFPMAAAARLVRSRVVMEQAATFVPTPGIDAIRPGPRSPFANLILAGDWTATDWPATMEGAIRSGQNAASAIGPNGNAAP